MKLMKLTIEGILRRLVNSVATQFGSEYVEFHNKSIARTAADIQAYVKQEMRKIVVGVEFCNSDISAKGLQDKILKAIENYGKDKGGL